MSEFLMIIGALALPLAIILWVRKKQKGKGGISRKNYFLSCLLLPIAIGAIAFALGNIIPLSETGDYIGEMIGNLLGFLFPVILYIFAALRYQNIGYRPAWGWALFLFVPLFAFWVVGRCLYQPHEYRQTKTMDRAGKVIFCIYWGALLAVIGLFAYVATI